MQQYLFEHFNSDGHHCFLDKISITLIDKTNPSEALKRENCLMKILKTTASSGLSVQEST